MLPSRCFFWLKSPKYMWVIFLVGLGPWSTSSPRPQADTRPPPPQYVSGSLHSFLGVPLTERALIYPEKGTSEWIDPSCGRWRTSSWRIRGWGLLVSELHSNLLLKNYLFVKNQYFTPFWFSYIFVHIHQDETSSADVCYSNIPSINFPVRFSDIHLISSKDLPFSQQVDELSNKWMSFLQLGDLSCTAG